jgi:hypothetical protein
MEGMVPYQYQYLLGGKLTWNCGAPCKRVALIATQTRANRIVICDAALRISAAQARTGIPTLLLDAGGCLRALRAHQTLWSTIGRRADVVSLARAHAHPVLHLELAVGTAGVGVAGIQLLYHGNTSRHKLTLCDGIAGVASQTRAYRLMTVGVADGVDAAGSRTRVDTLVVDAGPVSRTIRVENALWAAGQVGVAKVTGDAGAGTGAQLGAALCISSTRRWLAGIFILCRPEGCR